MKHVPFATTGVRVSRLCLGTMMFGYRADETESKRIIDAALDRNVNFFDTASMYAEGKTEEIVGRAIKGRRDRVFLATKVNVPNGADYPHRIVASLDESLARMGADYVDLFLLHWARANMDPVPIMESLAKVVRSGKARFIGVCNFPAWILARFNAVGAGLGAPRLVSNQIPYNLIERGVEIEVLPQAVCERIAVTCYRPLMAGVLAGKYLPGQTAPADSRATDDDRIPKWAAAYENGVRKLLEIAAAHKRPASHISLAWLNSRPGVACPIVGVSKLGQFLEAADAFDFELPQPQADELANAFGCDVKEVSQFYGPLRRATHLVPITPDPT